MKRSPRTFAALAALAGVSAFAPDAEAAPRWASRPLTLQRHVFAGDVVARGGHVGVRDRDFPRVNADGGGETFAAGFGVQFRIE